MDTGHKRSMTSVLNVIEKKKKNKFIFKIAALKSRM